MTTPTLTNDDRPRERLWRRGPINVGDEELIAILLGTGVREHPALAIASELVRASGGVAALSRASPRELSQVLGVGSARAARVAAAFELGRRAVDLAGTRVTLSRPEDIFACVRTRVTGIAQELFLVVGVDIRNHLLDIVEVARGSLAGVEVHPREVFRPLIRMAAAGGVLVHNHPSGDPTPSPEDIALTRRLRAVGDMLGVPVIDHVVICANAWRSVDEWMGTDL